MNRRPRRRPAASARSSAPVEPELAPSLILMFPLLLVYQLAIVAVPAVVATDPVSRLLYAACGGRTGYLLVQAGVALAFLAWMRFTGRSRLLALAIIAPVAAESVAIAFLLWLGLPLLLAGVFGLGSGASVVSAIGAGIYEELAFRLLLLGGLLRLGRAAELPPRVALALAIVASSLAFAAAHHLGAAGEAWSASAFGYRLAAGLVLGLTARLRSLAHAAYTHVAYDLLVVLA